MVYKRLEIKILVCHCSLRNTGVSLMLQDPAPYCGEGFSQSTYLECH